MAKVISVPEHIKLKQCHCDKGKHRFRENKFGVTWCVICGQLSTNNAGVVAPLEEDEGPVDHITLNDGADEYWCKVYCGMSDEEFKWYKQFYEEFEVRLLQPDIEYNWYGILGVNIRYYDENGYMHRCEVI